MSPILRDMIRNWDAKDVRNLILSVLALVIPIYFQKIIGFSVDIVSEFSSSLSTQFIDSLYHNASGNPIAITSLLVFSIIYMMPITILIINRVSLSSKSSTRKLSGNTIINFLEIL